MKVAGVLTNGGEGSAPEEKTGCNEFEWMQSDKASERWT